MSGLTRKCAGSCTGCMHRPPFVPRHPLISLDTTLLLLKERGSALPPPPAPLWCTLAHASATSCPQRPVFQDRFSFPVGEEVPLISRQGQPLSVALQPPSDALQRPSTATGCPSTTVALLDIYCPLRSAAGSNPHPPHSPCLFSAGRKCRRLSRRPSARKCSGPTR